MAKFLKVILFLILAAAFCGSVSDAFTVQTVDEITIAATTYREPTHEKSDIERSERVDR